jgi:DNA-directed RNA polymerase specialized sigma24 family protein
VNTAERARLHAAIVRFADGERASFREVFDGLWSVCLALATRSLRDASEAEDTAQRAILKVFDRIVDFDRERDGVSWALTITAFEILTTRKQGARRRDGTREWDAQDLSPRVDEQLVEHELLANVRALIGEMSDLDRETLEAMLGGATATGETERKRRFRAIERLRAAWRKAHG